MDARDDRSQAILQFCSITLVATLASLFRRLVGSLTIPHIAAWWRTADAEGIRKSRTAYHAVPNGSSHLRQSHALTSRGLVIFRHRPFDPLTCVPRRPLFVPGSAAARGPVKAARFRTAFVQLRAFGVLRTAYDSPAFPPWPSTGHRGRHWGVLISERTKL
jgi:hypothetical protein